MNPIIRTLRQSFRSIPMAGRIGCLAIIAVLFAFEGYVLCINHFEGGTPLPPNFGNHPAVIRMLTDQKKKEAFRFAVAGDTKSIGTFERIAEKLRTEPLDFAVLLGDVAYNGTEAFHRLLRAEIKEYKLEVPTFYIIGNHDVEPATFPVRRFEEIYGPGIFSFVYQDCLFIGLRILDEPYSNQESIDFLTHLASGPTDSFRHKFVFMHIPPPISSDFHARSFTGGAKLVALFNKLQVDYVFAGDFHGYARTRFGSTNYLVSGGGGARLKNKRHTQFHHAVVVTVSQDRVSERIIQVDKSDDFEDALEKLAIGEVYPWLIKYRLLVVPANAILLVIFCGMFYTLRKYYKNESYLSNVNHTNESILVIMTLSQHRKTQAAILMLLFCMGFLLFFYKVGDRDLWAPDEDEYAQMSREMIRYGHWIFPTVNGQPWAIKPVLYNWLIAAVALPGGDVNEFDARIFSALAALGTFLLTFYLGRRMFSTQAGFLAATVLGTSILFLKFARWSQTYMLSTFFAMLALFLFYRGYRSEDKRTVSYLLMYAATGLGVLTMGPVNLAMPGLVIFLVSAGHEGLAAYQTPAAGMGNPDLCGDHGPLVRRGESAGGLRLRPACQNQCFALFSYLDPRAAFLLLSDQSAVGVCALVAVFAGGLPSGLFPAVTGRTAAPCVFC